MLCDSCSCPYIRDKDFFVVVVYIARYANMCW